MDVAIIGAGELGGALAHVLARRDVARTIRLIDDAGRVAAGKALDIMQAAPIEGFATRCRGLDRRRRRPAGAAIVVIADRAGGGEWQGEDGLAAAEAAGADRRRARSSCAPARRSASSSSAASASSRFARDAAVRHRRRKRWPAAVRAIVALEANGSPRDVALTVLGVPPSQIVDPVGGCDDRRLRADPAARRAGAPAARGAGRGAVAAGPYALAAAAAKAIDGDRRALAPDRQLLRRARRRRAARARGPAALPVRLGPARHRRRSCCPPLSARGPRRARQRDAVVGESGRVGRWP